MKRVFIVLLIATSIGGAFGLYFFLSGSSSNPLNILTSILYSVNIGSLMMLFIYHRNALLELVPYQGLKLLLMMFLLMVAAVVGTELTRLIRDVVLFDREFRFMGEPNIYFLNIIIVLVTGLPIYQREVWKSSTDARMEKQRYELLKLEQLKTQTELEMLRAKVNPHFLYNVHNTIAGLIPTQPAKAEQLVLLLSRFFRYTLNKNSSTYNTVEEEVEIVQTYLQMQQLRFGDRMQVQVHIAGNLLQQFVPSFILQPLVENAVKHSIEKLPSVGLIDINVHQELEKLIIQVGDNGPAFADELHYGFGLQGILNKLNLLYHDNYTFTIQNPPEKHVRIELPITSKA